MIRDAGDWYSWRSASGKVFIGCGYYEANVVKRADKRKTGIPRLEIPVSPSLISINWPHLKKVKQIKSIQSNNLRSSSNIRDLITI